MGQAKKIFITALIIVVGLVSIGCGPQSLTNQDSLASSQSAALADTVTGKAIANCSHDVANQTNLGVRLKIAADNASLVHLKFDRFPTTYTGTSKGLIQIATTNVDSAGNKSTLKQVPFAFEASNGSGLFQTLSTSYTQANWSDIQSIATLNSISGKTANDIFSKLDLLVNLQDNSNTAKILTVFLYEDGGTSPTAQVEVLVPKFYANPADYNANHAEVLQLLHPLRYMLGCTWTNTDFQTESDRFCIQ